MKIGVIKRLIDGNEMFFSFCDFGVDVKMLVFPLPIRIAAAIPLVALSLILMVVACDGKVERKTAEMDDVDFTFNVGGVPFDMIFVRGGTYTMGCTTTAQQQSDDTEKWANTFVIEDFYIGRYEVTQVQWMALLDTNPSRFKGDNLPVESVTWDMAQTFITALNTQTNRQFRLPTEAEWEYAARGGSKSRGYRYSGSDNIDEVAWYHGNTGGLFSGGSTRPVGTKAPNELGIYDMTGNVQEWIDDSYGDYMGRSKCPTPCSKPTPGTWRGERGCCWHSIERFCSVTDRINPVPLSFSTGCFRSIPTTGSSYSPHRGFRLILGTEQLRFLQAHNRNFWKLYE